MMARMARPFPWPFRSRLSVRFRDLDAYGHVNNAVFATYFEQARTECYLALKGREDPCDLDAGLDFVVARTEIDHLAPIVHGDLVEVEVRPSRLGRSSFDLAYEARTERRGPVARGLTVCVAYDHARGASRPVDESLAALLREGLGAAAP